MTSDSFDAADLDDDLDELLHWERHRPLGEVVRAGRVPGQRHSDALGEAVDNLLDKAALAVDAGDQAKVERLCQRIADLPFDDRERIRPGLFWPEIRIFSTMVDALEELPEEPGAEFEWLTAVKYALYQAEPDAAQILRRVLADLAVEAEWRLVDPDVIDELQQLTQGHRAEPPEELPEDARRRHVQCCVAIDVALNDAFDALIDEWLPEDD